MVCLRPDAGAGEHSVCRNLEAVLRLATNVCSSLSTQATLETACQAAVQLFGADHSGLVIFSSDLSEGTVAAEYPPGVGAFGRKIQIKGLEDEERLIYGQESVVIEQVDLAMGLGPVQQLLQELKIKSIAIVPIIGTDRPLGSFSLDSIGAPRVFLPHEIDLCRAFA